MNSYRIAVILTGFILFVCVVFFTRKRLLLPRFGVLWFVASAILISVGCFPGVNIIFEQFLGFTSLLEPIQLVLVLLACVKIMHMDIQSSRQEVGLIRLTQRLALLEAELRDVQLMSRANSAASETGKHE